MIPQHAIPRWFSALATLLAGIAIAHAAPPQRWTIEELGALGSGGAIPLAINNRGDIGGYSTVEAGFGQAFHAFVWNGTMQDYGASLGSPPGTGNSQVTAINDRGVAVGNGPLGVLRWNPGVPAPEALGFQGRPEDINRRGDIVGQYFDGSTSRAFLYSDGLLRDLGTLGGDWNAATAINDRGAIVGWSGTTGGLVRGFIYENATMRDIGSLGGDYTVATDINNRGVVVGSSELPDGRIAGFVYDPATGMQALPIPGNDVRIVAINDRGAIIGDNGTHSFLYEDGELTLLEQIPAVQEAGFTRLFVTDINDRGWITGWGWKPGGPVEGVAFVLKPR